MHNNWKFIVLAISALSLPRSGYDRIIAVASRSDSDLIVTTTSWSDHRCVVADCGHGIAVGSLAHHGRIVATFRSRSIVVAIVPDRYRDRCRDRTRSLPRSHPITVVIALDRCRISFLIYIYIAFWYSERPFLRTLYARIVPIAPPSLARPRHRRLDFDWN